MSIPKYYSDVNEANSYMRQTLELLGKYGLPPNLVNITLCYEYVTGNSKALRQALDESLGKGGEFSSEQAEELYKSFIWDDEKRTHDELNQVLNKHFADALFSINKVRSSASDSSKSIEHHSEKLKAEDISKPNIKQVVNTIVAETDKLVNISQTFETELEQQKNELEQLKAELKETKELAETDSLTKLKNRRSFEKAMAEYCSDPNDELLPLSLLILDIDLFKKVNDKYGHLVGDRVICFVAQTLTQNIKGKDLAARIGGEEFAIILPKTKLKNALLLAEDLRKIIERSRLSIIKTQEKLDPFTISIGATCFKPGDSQESFFSRADRALYSSKKTGRNKVTSFMDDKVKFI